MKIKITLTNPEFDYITKIRNGGLADDSTMHARFVAYGLIDRRTDRITELGQLAWEQNKPKEAKVEKPTDEAYRQCVAYWLKDFHLGWNYGAVHGVAMKSILAKIRKAQPDSTTATVVATFKKLCQSLPEWYKTKDLPVINSKFNEIITEIQQGPKRGYYQQNSAERFFGGY